MRTLSNSISKVEKYLSMVLMLAMAVIIALAVGFRYLLNAPLAWASEISIFLLIWISFIGGSLGLKYQSQAAVTIIIELIPEQIRRIVLIIGHILMILFLFSLIYYSVEWILSPSVAVQRSTTLLIPMWIPYIIVPVGLLFASIHLASNLADILRKGEDQ